MGIIDDSNEDDQHISTLSSLERVRVGLSRHHAAGMQRYLRQEPVSSPVSSRGQSRYPIKVNPPRRSQSLKAKSIEPLVVLEPREITDSLKAAPRNVPIDFSVYFTVQQSSQSQKAPAGTAKTFGSSIFSLFSGTTANSPPEETMKESMPSEITLGKKSVPQLLQSRANPRPRMTSLFRDPTRGERRTFSAPGAVKKYPVPSTFRRIRSPLAEELLAPRFVGVADGMREAMILNTDENTSRSTLNSFLGYTDVDPEEWDYAAGKIYGK